MMTPRGSVVVALLTLSVVARLVPYALSTLGMSIDPATTTYPWNFSPILPICIFGGAMYARWRLAYLIPLATFLLGDVGIWALTGRVDWAFYPHQPSVYISVALVVTTGFLVRNGRTWAGVTAAGLSSSILFFVLTNFGVWALGDGTLYPHTAEGLAACYLRAVPYFRNTLVSMAVFLPLLFSRVGLRETPALAFVQPATRNG